MSFDYYTRRFYTVKTSSVPMPFMSVCMDPKTKLLALAYRLVCVSLLIKILLIGHLEQTRAVLLIVGPISEN